MAHAAALSILGAEPGLTRYLGKIRRVPMLEPQEEYLLAKRWTLAARMKQEHPARSKSFQERGGRLCRYVAQGGARGAQIGRTQTS